MILLGQSAFLKALGWALLNSLWQFGFLWLVFIILINARKNLPPTFKHGLAVVLLSIGFAWFAAELSIQYFNYSDPTEAGKSLYLIHDSELYATAYNNVSKFLESNLSYLSVVYILVVATLSIKFFGHFHKMNAIQSRGLSKLPAELRLYVQQLAKQLGVTRKIEVWMSDFIDTPLIIGFVKPTILIPIACINQLTVKQLEAILLHEIAHVKRNDYLVNLYTATTEILFFFNPFTKLLIASIRQEREKCCDDWVVQFRFDRHQYASALLRLEQTRLSIYATAMAATGSCKKVLLHRIQRILGVNNSKPDNGFQLMAYFLTIGLLSFIVFVHPGDVILKKSEGSYFSKSPVKSPFSVETKQESTLSGSRNDILPPNRLVDKQRKEKNNGEALEIMDLDGSSWTALSDIHSISNVIEDWEEESPVTLIETINEEESDFCIPEKTEPIVPPAALVNELPYVPHASFFYSGTDTIRRKVKKISYKDRVATESLSQAQKAIDKIDWNKIQKELKGSKVDLIKLRKEIQQSLKELNWNEIREEVSDSLNQVLSKDMHSSLSEELEVMKAYKATQQQYEQLRNKLIQQQDKYKKAAESDLLKLQKQVSKIKVTVHI